MIDPIAEWRALAKTWESTGQWNYEMDGPAPDQPGTFVPAQVREEFGIKPRSSRPRGPTAVPRRRSSPR
jgi:hypothetical protein